jgi:signal transduction histidine kinase
MRLAKFILQDMEAILAEWEAFAATLLPAAEGMTPLALRDHAHQILAAVAKDMITAQDPAQQSEKSKGWTVAVDGASETAAQTHAVLRARSGFNINQLVAEYRALRATVLRLWLDSGPLDGPEAQEIIRFNEAIDQAVAESVGHFDTKVEQARNLLLGMLGHDMRSPLQAILATASHLAHLGAGNQVSEAAARLIRSGASIQSLLDDLVDFNRTRFGLGLRIVRSDVDLASAVAEELEQLRAAYPTRRIELEVTGDSRGRWDGARLKQLLRNLVSNAIQHGSPSTPVRVALGGEQADVRLEVTNTGPSIDPSALDQMFDPIKRVPPADDGRTERLGLGLFIVREIVAAHMGEVEVHSEKGETTFAVRLPRRERSASPEREPAMA